MQPATGQGADVRDERAVAKRRGGLAGSNRLTDDRGHEVGEITHVEPIRIGAVHEQLGIAADLDHPDEARSLHRLRGDRDTRWIAAWPGQDGEAEPRREQGNAAAGVTQRDGQRIVDDEPRVLGDQRVVGTEADPEQGVEGGAADEGRLRPPEGRRCRRG